MRNLKSNNNLIGRLGARKVGIIESVSAFLVVIHQFINRVMGALREGS